MKKTLFILAALALAIISCDKEVIDNQATPKETPQEIVFELTANHPDGPDTRAVKTGWENGDVIFVFLNNVAAPKYLKMSYDGKRWNHTQMNGATEGSLGLTEGATGTMRAVYLPFGGAATVSANETSFVFSETPCSYYLTATIDYTVTDGKVSGIFDMRIPDGYIQFFLDDAAASSSTDIELREPHLTPQGIASIAADGTITHTSVATGAPLKGYVYDKGYLFSGILDAGARNTSTNYRFTVVKGGWEGSYYAKDFYGKTWYRGAAEGRALKMPALTDWTAITDYKPIDIGCDVNGRRIYWASRNLGATADTPAGTSDAEIQATFGDFFAWGETEPYYTEGHAYDNPCANWKDGKTGYDLASNKWYVPDYFTKYYPYNGQETLLPEDDAARAKLGGIWRMPSYDECMVLTRLGANPPIDFNWGWDGDKRAYYVSGQGEYANRRLYFPAAGYREDTEYKVDNAWYWASSVAYDKGEGGAFYFELSGSSYVSRDVFPNEYRQLGYCIRAVTE